MFIGLNPFDRFVTNIEIAVACAQADWEFNRELHRANRAAGNNKNTKGANPISNITGPSTTSSNDNVKPVEEVVKTENSTALVVKAAEIKANIPAKPEEQQPTKVVHTERRIGDEVTSEEKNDVEKIVGQVDANSIPEAAMAGGARIGDGNPGVLDFSAFGPVSINLHDIAAGPNAVTVQPRTIIDQNAQFPIMEMGGMNTYGQVINNVAPGCISAIFAAGQGRHRVDNPVPTKPPKPEKAEPEKVEMNLNPVDIMDIQPHPQKFDVRTYSVLGEDAIKPADVATVSDPVSLFPSNAALYQQYPYLEDIEKIALSNGYQILFDCRKTGLIDCWVCKQDGQGINGKGFTIDSGFIFDHREKIFAGIFEFYEGMNAYHLFIGGDVRDGKKTHNVLNTDLIKNLIVAGNHIVDGVKGMYSPDFVGLNAIVPLITIPTDKIGRADRKYIQNRLVGLYKDRTFSSIADQYPNSRFRIAYYNKGDKTIILDSDMVPKNYGGKYYPSEPIQIKITENKFKVLRGENMIDLAKL